MPKIRIGDYEFDDPAELAEQDSAVQSITDASRPAATAPVATSVAPPSTLAEMLSGSGKALGSKALHVMDKMPAIALAKMLIPSYGKAVEGVDAQLTPKAGNEELAGGLTGAAHDIGSTVAGVLSGTAPISAGGMTQVARYGSPITGEAGQMVMAGGKSPLSYAMSGKWLPTASNQAASYASGTEALVPSASLTGVKESGGLLDLIKTWLAGQRQFAAP